MVIFSKSESTIKEIWTTTIRLYKKAFIHVWPLGLMFSITSTMFSILQKNNSVDSKIIIFILPLILVLVTVYISSLFIVKYYDIGNGKEINWKNTLSTVSRKYFIVLFAVVFAITVSTLASFMLVVPGVFLFVLFIMIKPLVLLNNNGIISSIKNSPKLIWGNWWRTSATLLPIALASISLGLLTNEAIINQKWPMLGIDMLISSALYPLIYACLLALYNDLKIRRELAIETLIKTKK